MCRSAVVLHCVLMLLAAPGNVTDHVIIERQSESTVTFCEGAKESYLGYVTLKVQNLRQFSYGTFHEISNNMERSVFNGMEPEIQLPLKRFPDSGFFHLMRAGWFEEGLPATENSLQYPWVDNWLMAIFPLLNELTRVKCRMRFGCLPWGKCKCPTLA